jgi:hypothetical protein
MQLLKILMLAFFLLLISPSAFAQPETVQPKFSVGFSLGLPSSLHLFLRDIGIQGLGLRADVGGDTLIFLGYFQAAANLEYHLSPIGMDGFYLGVGLAVAETYLLGLVDLPTYFSPWQLAVQAYVGADQGQYFYELGVMAFLDGGFRLRFAVGYHIVF